ncbi:YetF domain-containing protein [Bacillaceae bacterium CLA-AA-H227]|uniref:YetF domain-containing protein n=1 Tax=Robertmurraya yapensis (ex Hitch et al 2024) TaxID=3133160 RepID=A0ACC6S555_9BACI
MEFFQSQDSLTAMEWALRAVVAYFFLLVVTRVLGQRAISQLRPLDFAMALVIGNIIAHPLSDEHLGLKGSIITTVVLVVLYILSIYIILKWPWARKLLTPEPITIVKDGEIIYKGLKRARITLDLLLEELREEKIVDVKKVALAIWEAHGKFSIFLDPKYEPLTPSTMQTGTRPFDFPKTIIKEGKLNTVELIHTKKNEEWVISKLENLYQTEIKNVLLATLDSQDNLKVFLYK